MHFFKYLHCDWFILSSHEVKHSEILRCLTLVAVLTNSGARTLTNMTSQFDVTMGKERRQPRYQGSLRATFDLRLYLYTFDCEKNKIK